MSNVRPLRCKDITPTVILESLHSKLPEIAEIYVVTVLKDEHGTPEIYSSGDLRGMGIAALVFTDYAMRVVRGEVIED